MGTAPDSTLSMRCRTPLSVSDEVLRAEARHHPSSVAHRDVHHDDVGSCAERLHRCSGRLGLRLQQLRPRLRELR